MVWDLRGALLKKEEMESARLVDFEFRLRVRTLRLLAERLGLDSQVWAARTAERSDAAIFDLLALETGLAREAVAARHAECEIEARAALIRERGDPAPFRLS